MTLSEIQELATIAHTGQYRRDGVTPYIEHPQAVAALLTGEKEQMVAWLHDVIEDTDYTAQMLLDLGVDPSVVSAVEIMTHHDDEPYMVYIDRVAQNLLSRTVKLADIQANLSDSPTDRQIQKYARAESYLEYYHKFEPCSECIDKLFCQDQGSCNKISRFGKCTLT